MKWRIDANMNRACIALPASMHSRWLVKVIGTAIMLRGHVVRQLLAHPDQEHPLALQPGKKLRRVLGKLLRKTRAEEWRRGGSADHRRDARVAASAVLAR